MPPPPQRGYENDFIMYIDVNPFPVPQVYLSQISCSILTNQSTSAKSGS